MRLTVMISRLLLPIIIVAELFSWYAIISTNYAGAVIEETLWTLTRVTDDCRGHPLYGHR